MKKRILSIALALAMVFSLLPINSTAAESADEDEIIEEILSSVEMEYTHPTHLTEGSFSISDKINKDVKTGILVFSTGRYETTGSVRLKEWSVDDHANVYFTIANAKEGDTITLYVNIKAEYLGTETLKVVVTIGYDRITLTSATTVTFGKTLRLTCAGLTEGQSVIYNIVSGKEYATIKGDILTPLKVGTVVVEAIPVPSGGEEDHSKRVTITIEKATPTVSVDFTSLDRAGLTLSDAQLGVNIGSTDGRIDWVLPDSTIVLANVAYEWIFIPSDTDNYHTITGTVTPYAVKDEDFVIGDGTTVRNEDGSYTTVAYGADDSRYELTEYPDGHYKLIHRRLDGTVVTLIKEADDTRTETTKYTDGSVKIEAQLANNVIYSFTKDNFGRVDVQVSLPYSLTSVAAKNGTVIDLPIPEIPNTDNLYDAPVVVFTVHTSDPVRVSIPINNPSAGTVAIFVAKNGEETVVKTSTTGKDSLYVTLSGSTTVKVVDAAKKFKDVSRNEWFHSAVDFVTSHGLFQGVDATTFAPKESMSRAMIVQVLHNLEGNPNYGIYPFYTDILGTWYAVPASWATRCGYINGFPDGTFRGEEKITWEQFAVILYRYVGSPSVSGFVNTPIYDYYDYTDISLYAWDAMYWAVNSGVLYTDGDNHLSPQSEVSRAEVAQTFRNLIEYLNR